MKVINQSRLFQVALVGALAMPLSLYAQQDHPGHMMNHGDGDMAGMMEHMQHMHAQMHAAADQSGGTVFATIQQMVRDLQADPNTDWSTVNIAALQQHLVDMEHLSLFAKVDAAEIPNGARFTVSGEGRTLEAIERMIPAHAAQMATESDWKFVHEKIRNGMLLAVTSDDPADVAQIRALGFMGIMVLGEHHEQHHSDMAGASGGDHSAHTH